MIAASGTRSAAGTRTQRGRCADALAGLAPWISAIVVGVATTAGHAQRLNLDPAPPAPALPERNAASALAVALAQEVEPLTARARSAGDLAWKIEASIAWRRVAHEMLVRGAEPGQPRNDLVEAGFRLADARGEFDRAIDRIPSQGRAFDRAREGLDRFVAAPAVLRATPTAELAGALERALANANGVLEGAGLPRVRNPWPVIGGAASSAESTPWSARLRHAARAESIPPEVAGSLERIAAAAEAAEQWSDLDAELGPICEPLLEAPSLAASISKAKWMPESRRTELQARLARAVASSESADGRDAARLALEHLAAVARAIDATEALVRPISKSPRGPIDPARPLKAITALASAAPDERETTSRIERLDMISPLLATMAEVRRRDEADVRRSLRTLRRELSREALKSEEPVLRQVESLAAPDAHPTDPACASLLESQRRRIRAIAALDGIDRALGEIEARMPGSARPLEAKWIATLKSIGDAGRGETILPQAEAFVSQWNQVRELAAEKALRQGDAVVIELAAGRVPELLAALDSRRAAWAAAWSAGDGDKAIAAIGPMLELFALVEDAAALSRSRANPRLIGRWGGWDDLGGVPGSTDAMDARVALAVEALARNDDSALREALSVQAREAPIWRLRAQLLRVLAEPLAGLPDGLSGAIGRACLRPRSAALMSRRADDLFTLARYSREYLFALGDRDRERADRIHEFLRELATDLRRDLEREIATTAPAPPSTPAK